MKISTPLFLILLSFASAPLSLAAINATGNFLVGGSGSPPTLTITAPFTLVANTTTSVNFLMMDNWVASFDGNISLLSAAAGSQLFYQINGGLTLSNSLTFLYDHFNPPNGDVDTRDGALVFEPIALTAGDSITILSQTLVFARDHFVGNPTNFNPPPASFQGEVFMTSNSGTLTAFTNHVSVVPEPSPLLLGGIGALGCLRRRMR